MKNTVRAVAALSALSLVNCGATAESAHIEAGAISLAASILADQCGITKATLDIAADDLASRVGPLPLDVAGAQSSGRVDSIPAGTQRKVTVTAYDQNNQPVYEGSSFVDIQANKVTDAALMLYRNFDNCPFQGTPPLVENGGVSVKGELSNDFLAFSFSGAELASNGVIYLIDDTSHFVRTYDVPSGSFGDSLSIPKGVSAAAVSADGANIYLAYDQGRMDKITTATRERVFFTAGPARISSMAVVGDYVFTIDGSGAWNSETLYDRRTGRRTSTADWRNASQSIVFAPSLSKVFTLSDGVSPNDVCETDVDLSKGTVGAYRDSPYHGDYALGHPLRLFPEELRIAASSGIVFNTSDLTYSGSMGMPYVDLAFHDDKLYLLEHASEDSEIVVLDGRYAVIDRVALQGAPLRVFVHGQTLLTITQTKSGLRLMRYQL